MNIRKFIAPDMRTAFKTVRSELGDDVVILSSRKVRDQIEVTVAADQATADAARAKALAARAVSGRVSAPTSVNNLPSDARVDALDGELRALRRLLETQLAALAWNDLSRRSPGIAELSREWSDLGFERELLSRILATLPQEAALEDLRRLARTELQGQLSTTRDEWIERGGRVVFVGPTGCGKTTALAALAARWVMRNGTQGVVLISAGETRVGAGEQLQRMGRLLGSRVIVEKDLGQLAALLSQLRDERLVLVDTAGCAPRQNEYADYSASLSAVAHDVEFAVTLSASLQVAALGNILAAYVALGRVSAVITHLDEGATLGGLLSRLVEHAIPLAYTLAGSRLLDDLRPANLDALLDRAFAAASVVEVTPARVNRYVA
jgi:flagellar biosynthesis protein FlhF